MTFDEALRVLMALEREDVAYVLIGSMAMAARAVVRATRDIDLMVSPDHDNIARLRSALSEVFDDTSIDEITAADLVGEYPVLQYRPPHANYSIDIIARLGERFTYDDIEWDWVEVEGSRFRVATPAMLYEMKRDTVREQDRADAAALKRRFDLGRLMPVIRYRAIADMPPAIIGDAGMTPSEGLRLACELSETALRFAGAAATVSGVRRHRHVDRPARASSATTHREGPDSAGA